MNNEIILILKGALIGIANIIPGVSGGTLAITLGLYEKIITTITNFFKDIKNNLKFIISLGLGAGLGLLLVSKIIVLALDNYPLPTNVFFVGLILGGIPILFKKVKYENKTLLNLFIFLLVFVFIMSLSFIKDSNYIVSFNNMNLFKYLKLFLIGIIAAGTMVIPGISGSFVLITLGYYKPILDTLNTLTTFYKLEFNDIINNGLIILIFGIGVLVGILLIAKIIEYLLNKFETKTYYAIIGFVLGSIIVILKPLLITKLNFYVLAISIPFGLIGFIIAYYLGERG